MDLEKASREFDGAMDILHKADELPLSRLKEYEERSREGLRQLTKISLVDVTSLAESRFRLIEVLKDWVQFLNRWVVLTTAAWIGSLLVVSVRALSSVFVEMEPPIAGLFFLRSSFRGDGLSARGPLAGIAKVVLRGYHASATG